jgi:hypothetical protein
MYRTQSNSNGTIFLVCLAVLIYFFMPKSLTVKIPKDIALPVTCTLAVVSLVRR